MFARMVFALTSDLEPLSIKMAFLPFTKVSLFLSTDFKAVLKNRQRFILSSNRFLKEVSKEERRTLLNFQIASSSLNLKERRSGGGGHPVLLLKEFENISRR